MLKRDLSYDLFSRELQDELFSRELEDWAEWAKREPSPGQVMTKVVSKVTGYTPPNYVPPPPGKLQPTGKSPTPLPKPNPGSVTGPQTNGITKNTRPEGW